MMQTQLNPTVGVAPGTTTLTLGGASGCALGDCPPDEALHYVQPPRVQEGYPSGVTADGAIPLPTFWDPYTDPPQLKGLGDDGSSPRWSLALFTGLLAFAVVLGVGYLRHRKK